MVALLNACGDNESEKAEDPAKAKQATAAANQACNQAENPLLDCGCADKVVAGAWSDDPTQDVPTLLKSEGADLSQASINALIDVALKTNDQCAK